MASARSDGRRRQGVGPAWSRARGILARAGYAAFLAGLPAALDACCLVRPPDAKTLVAAGNAGWRTPEAAFEVFRVAFGADLPELEYRSLSLDFRRREGVSYQTYRIARERLLSEHPLLALLAGAEIVESEGRGERSHRLVVRAGGRSFVVDLVREDRFQIYAGTVFLADGAVDFEHALRFRAAPGGLRAVLDLLVPEEDLAGVELSRATSFTVEQTWKIERFGDAPLP
jgi:hypothetical protein